VPQQKLNHVPPTPLRGDVERRPALVVPGVWICAISEEDSCDVSHAVFCGSVQSRIAGGVPNVGVRAVPQQQLDQRGISPPHGGVERNPPAVLHVGIRAVSKQQLRHSSTAARNSLVERVASFYVCSMSKEELGDLDATKHSGVVQRRLALVVSGVWICAAFEQKLRQLRPAELGGVVERRLAGGILNVGIRASLQPLLHILHVTCHSNVEGGVPQDDLPAAIS